MNNINIFGRNTDTFEDKVQQMEKKVDKGLRKEIKANPIGVAVAGAAVAVAAGIGTIYTTVRFGKGCAKITADMVAKAKAKANKPAPNGAGC